MNGTTLAPTKVHASRGLCNSTEVDKSSPLSPAADDRVAALNSTSIPTHDEHRGDSGSAKEERDQIA